MSTATAMDAAKAATAELHQELMSRGHWLRYVIQKAAVVTSRAKRRIPVAATSLYTEIGVKNVITIVVMDHYFVATSKWHHDTPWLKQRFLGKAPSVPITIWLREDGAIVYNESFLGKPRNYGVSKTYPLEEVSSRQLQAINAGLNHFNYDEPGSTDYP